MLAGVVVAPAQAVEQLPSEWDSWFATGNLTDRTETDGALCVDVPGGTANRWDAILGYNGVELQAGVEYTLAFEASASADVTVHAQVGVNAAPYPTVAATTADLGTEMSAHELTFTATEAVPGGDAGGQVAFQLGHTATEGVGSTEPYTFCVAGASFDEAGAGANLVPNGDFASGQLDPWFSAVGTPDFSSGGLCVVVPATSTQFQGVGFNGLAIEEGTTYTLSYRASASSPRTIRTLVGENGGAFGTVLDETAQLGPEMAEYSQTFTATASYPAVTTPGGPFEGQLAFQVGGRGEEWTLCLDDVSLVESTTPPPPYEPETGPAVRVNQVGYLPEGPKRATVVTGAEIAGQAWQLRDGATVVASGTAVPAGVDPTSGLAVQVIDFSGFTTPGEAYTLAVGDEVSHPFAIDADLYQDLRYDALNYFYLARSGIDIEAGIVGEEYARQAGHLENPASTLVEDSPNKGDLDVPCVTAEDEGANWAYGDWTCSDGYALDVVGGWYDAGDHGKYVVNGGISTAQLLSTYERTLTAPTADAGALGDSTLNLPETGNGVPDVLDEAAWELDFMLSMQVPANERLAGMVHHKIHDVGWTGLPLLPAQDPQERRLHRPSTAATLNLAAAAAQGARLFDDYEEEYPGYADRLLEAAETAYAAALATPDLYAPAAAGNFGGGAYDDDEVGDEFYWAAAELFLTTGEDGYLADVLANPLHTADIWGPSGITWGATAGLGRLDLATVPSDLPNRIAVQESVVDGALTYLAWQSEQPFGTTYPGLDGDYEWGSNSMVANNQVVLGTAFDLTGDPVFRDAVLEGMDYLLGRNALNQSYVTGYGEVSSHNQHSRWFANSLDPSLPTPPPGSLAGGPNSNTGTWDPTISGLYGPEHMCMPQLCYIDHIQSWATNEITVNWNSVLSWVASFAADQGDAGDAAPSGLVTMAPTRILVDDSLPFGDTVRCWSVAGENGIPADATGVVVNVTAVAPGSPGYAVVFPDTNGDGTTRMPRTSTVNFEPGQDVSTATFTRLGPNGDLCYATQGGPARALLVDVSGYVTPDSGITLTAPARLADSRTPWRGGLTEPLAPRTVTTLQVAGRLGVPADAESVVVNVTVANVSSLGNLRLFGGGEVPNSSLLNLAPGVEKANTTVVELADDGTISLYADADRRLDVIVDVLGYTRAGTDHVGVTPTRVLDTRESEEGPLAADTVYTVPVRGDVVPVNATAVVLNVTAIAPSERGNLRVYPGAGAPPNASSVNYITGRDVANLVVVDLPVDGLISLYSDQAGAGTVDVAIDVVGYVTR